MTDPYPVICHQAPESTCSSLLRLATMGAVIGGSAAAAGNFRQVRDGRMEAGRAILDTGRSVAASGVAAALAGAVAGVVAEQGALRLGAMFAAGAVTLYGIQEWLGGRDGEQ